MSLRQGHGRGAGSPRIEVLPADELPSGLPADAVAASPTDFDDRGKFAQGNALASLGGKRKAGHTRLAARLTLGAIAAEPAFRPYLAAARGYRRAQCAALARDVGGGVCGPAPSSVVASAALQLAASRYLFDLAGQGNPDLFAVASKLANDSRQNLLAAHELCAREAKARPNPAERPFWLAADAPSDTSTTDDNPAATDAAEGQHEP